MNKKQLGTFVLLLSTIWFQKANAHIDLISPKPLLGGRSLNDAALKAPPFGAPGVNVEQAASTRARPGEQIHVEVDMYIYHPGDIVVLYTTDLTGNDIHPTYQIDSIDTPIPHKNLLASYTVPKKRETRKISIPVRLPNLTGDIILVVRQVMHDKLDMLPQGKVGLERVYYHQAAKIKLEPTKEKYLKKTK